MAWYLYLVGAVAAAVLAFLAYCNLPPSWLHPAEKATLEWLSSAPLEKLPSPPGEAWSDDVTTGEQLWRDRGAVIMAVRRPG